jgi:hypothetical protein
MPANYREKSCPAVAGIIRLAAALTLAALVLPALVPPAVAQDGTTERLRPSRRVVIAFVPGLRAQDKPPLINRIASHREFAVGYASAIQGTYEPEQTLLDISAGSRLWTSLYDSELPELIALAPSGRGGAISGWTRLRERAQDAPADIVPGTLAETFHRKGSVAYVGIEGRRNREAIVAADENGHVQRVTLTSPHAIGRGAVRELLRGARLLVVRLPAGRNGSNALADIRVATGPDDLLVLVESPSVLRRRLIAVGASGLGGGRNLRSATTRTDGLVSSTDIAPTAIEFAGGHVPDQVSGRQIGATGDRSVDDLNDMRNRLDEVGPRRWLLAVGGLAGAALLAGIAAMASSDGRLRLLGRAAFLAAVWLPSVLLATGALAPSRLGELALISASCALLALATDRLLPWPRAIALPAAVTIVSHVVDLAFGSDLIQRSLLGPNPILGARFYGVGNELEVTLGVIGLLGLGALFAGSPRRQLIWAFVIGGSALALTLSWGKLGADVGASIMIAAGAAAAAVAALGERPGKLRIALIGAAPLLALGVLAVLDIATGGDAHFTRSVLDAGGLGDLADIAQRRVELSYRSLTRGIIGLLVAVAVIALIWGVRSRRKLLAPLESSPGLRAGLIGALVAVVVGALSNDSGPMILLIGTSYLGLAAGYLSSTAK